MEEDQSISFEGLTPAEAVHALYHGTRPLGMGWIHNTPGFTVEDAQAAIDRAGDRPYFDYVAGRPLKVGIDLAANRINSPRLYDRDAGQGACATAIANALKGKR